MNKTPALCLSESPAFPLQKKILSSELIFCDNIHKVRLDHKAEVLKGYSLNLACWKWLESLGLPPLEIGMYSASSLLRTTVLCIVFALAWVRYSEDCPQGFVVASPVQGKSRVTGRVELINSKLRKPGAKLDTSGVAIWLESRGPRIQGAKPRQKLNQQGKRFIPHVLIIERGTEVDFPNSDPFYHNVFSLFDGRRFDLGLYASGESRPIAFNRAGISYIYCNIHPSMSAVIVSVDSPFFAVTDSNGNFSIPDVPPGTYDLKVWHERSTPTELNSLTREVRVASGSNQDVGVLKVNEAGYIPQTHLNKHGQTYDDERTNPRYKP